MSRKKKKKKFKQKKIDYTSMSRDDMKNEICKILNNISGINPTQKQIEFVEKKIEKIGDEGFSVLINLLLENGNNRDKAILLLMALNYGKEAEQALKELLCEENIVPEVRSAILCILMSGGREFEYPEFPGMIKNLIKVNSDTEDKDGKLLPSLEKRINKLSLAEKFLTMYFGISEKGETGDLILNIFSRSPVPKIRWELASKLSNIADNKVVPPLLRLREDKDSEVRIMAKRAISLLKGKGIDFFEQVKELPIHCCYITEDIKKNGLGTVLVARKFKEHYVNYSFFLIDVWGMGLKDVFGERRCHLLRFEKEVLPRFMLNPYGKVVEAHISLAKKLVLGGVEFAKQNGFRVPKEFLKWRDIIGSMEEEDKDYEDLFKKNGEILVMASPEDIMRRIALEGDKEEYYDDHKTEKPEISFEEVIAKLNERGIKFVTSFEDEVSEELVDILADKNDGLSQDEKTPCEIDEKSSETFTPEETEDAEAEEIEDAEAEEIEDAATEETENAVAEDIEDAVPIINIEEKLPVVSRVLDEKIVIEEVQNIKPVEVKKIKSPELRNRKTEYRKFDYNKKSTGEDFDLSMEYMYDDLEEFIFQEEYQRAYFQLEKMLRKASKTSWEEDVLKDILSFCMDNVDYQNKYFTFSQRLENFYKRREDDDLILKMKMDRADFLGFTGKTEEGLEIYNSILSENPELHQARLNLAVFYLNNNMLEKSVETYKNIIEKYKNVDEDTLADAIVDLINIIEEFALEGENVDYYKNIAEERNIHLCDEPEVVVKVEGNDYQI